MHAAFPVQFFAQLTLLCLLAQERREAGWKELHPLTVLQCVPLEGGCVKVQPWSGVLDNAGGYKVVLAPHFLGCMVMISALYLNFRST